MTSKPGLAMQTSAAGRPITSAVPGWRHHLYRLSRSRFLRNVAAVATGTAAAQAVTVACAPLIARQYGPAAFGVLGSFTALLGVIGPIAALSYPIAIVLPARESDARGLAWLSVAIALTSSVLVELAVFVVGGPLVRLLHLEAIEPFLPWLGPAMFLAACLQVVEQRRIRTKQFTLTARVAVLQSLLMNGAKAVAGFVQPLAATLVVLATLGNGLYATMLASGMRGSLFRRAGPGQTSLRELACRHRDFALYRAPQIGLNAAAQGLPVVMLASLFGTSAAGFYTLARTVLSMPFRLIGKAVSDVFYPRFTEAARHGADLRRLLLKGTGLLAVAGIVPFGLVAVSGPSLFRWVFGAAWAPTGEYARWLAIWLFFGFLNRPSVAAIATLSLQGFYLVYEIGSVVLRAAAIYAGFAWFHSDVAAVAGFSLAGAVLNATLISATLACSGGSRASVTAGLAVPGSAADDAPRHDKASMTTTQRSSTREKLAGLLAYLPDPIFYQYRYFITHRRLCNFRRPRYFSEKIFHRMRHPRPFFSRLADKLAARGYIADRVGERYLVPLYHSCERVCVDTFDRLPDTFVMKSNHSAGQVYVVHDKRQEDLEALATLANSWLDGGVTVRKREKHYRAIPPRILFEKALLEDGNPPDDYKFNVFNPGGERAPFVFIQYMRGRFVHLTQDLFLADWSPAPFKLQNQKCHGALSPRPPLLEEMLKLATTLAEPLGYLRVDFYVHDGRIYIGELTLTPGAGYYVFAPRDWDLWLGQRFGWPEGPTSDSASRGNRSSRDYAAIAGTVEGQ